MRKVKRALCDPTTQVALEATALNLIKSPHPHPHNVKISPFSP